MSGLIPCKSSTNVTSWVKSQVDGIQRSSSEIIVKRGFKPSDTKNPAKTKFLTELSQKMWGKSLEASGHKVNIEDGLHSKPIDLEKLFTPASDSGELTPSRNRKMFASSSFYSPNHPTMEEQVELARRISHSLSDISNKESKGQSMYVNRKKRSVKWVHEAVGLKENDTTETWVQKKESRSPLKFVMDPRGQVQDITMLQKQGIAVEPPMSPEVCFDLVRDLNATRGKGAELFAKRRKRSENWIIDENNVKTVETHTQQTQQSYQSSPSYLQSSQRVENVQKMNQIQERFTLPRLKLIKSPWEAALEGSVESAFQEINSPRGPVMAPTPTFQKLAAPTPPLPQHTNKDEFYKPKTPRAWNPQPACKSFSSVKLEKIFAGTPKSPVSLAYHPDTNTISTEPVISENIPYIASQLANYEVINQNILTEPKPRSLNQLLIYDKPEHEKTEKIEIKSQNIVKEETSEVTVSISETVSQKTELPEKETFLDKEVESFCEREFNALSLKYENIEKHEIKKPAALVPGAMPLFDLSSDFSSIKKEEPKPEPKSEYKKPPSMVPGAKPLFGGVGLHLEETECSKNDQPYEKIPVKNLINNFEQSTKPVMKIKQLQEKIEFPLTNTKTKEENTENNNNVEDITIKNETSKDEIKIGKERTLEELEIIEHHFEIEKHKREIYDQQIQKYKQEMKALRTGEKSTNFLEAQAVNNGLQQQRNEQVNNSHPVPVSHVMPIIPATSPKCDFTKMNNFNTAARGWQTSMTTYRPVTFNPASAYTDF